MKNIFYLLMVVVLVASCSDGGSSNPADNPLNPKSITFTVNGVSFKMIKVEGGTFQMGSNIDSYEQPIHSVTLSTYYIGETEVTQELWMAVMGRNPSKHKDDNLPVEFIDFGDCGSFVKKISQLTGETFTLPTEAQWEYAARGGNKSRGYLYSGSNNIDEVAWYEENSSDETHPVGTKKANELGLYDMSGNVWEWCSDHFRDYPSDEQTNHTQSLLSVWYIIRGGSFEDNPYRCRSTNRGVSEDDRLRDHYGIRLVLPYDTDANSEE